MSCGSCNCSPCSCDECDSNNEPLASALNNFIVSFYGTLTKTCVNNEVVWILPCDLEAGLAGFGRRQGEGVACYLLRLFEYLNGLILSVSSCAPFYNKIMVNGVCYTTWQEAYDANASVTVPTLMLVGQGTTFGDLTLTSAYNSNIVIYGLGKTSSVLGTLFSTFTDVVLEAYTVTIGSIDTRVAGIGGSVITLTGDAKVGVINNSRNDASAGSTLSVTVTGWDITSIDNSHQAGTGSAGNVILTKCTCGNIDVRTAGVNPGGVTLRHCSQIGSILNSGGVGSLTNVVIAEETNIISAAGLSAIQTLAGGVGGSSFINCKIKTVDTNQNCIADLQNNGSQFLNTVIVPNGTGISITAGVATTIIAYNLLMKNDMGANVTLSEGNYNFSPNIFYP